MKQKLHHANCRTVFLIFFVQFGKLAKPRFLDHFNWIHNVECSFGLVERKWIKLAIVSQLIHVIVHATVVKK